MIINVENRQLTGRAVIWDGTNLEEVREVAGRKFAGVHGNMVMIDNGPDRGSLWVQPTWTIVSIGTPPVVIMFTPEAAATMLQRQVPESGANPVTHS